MSASPTNAIVKSPKQPKPEATPMTLLELALKQGVDMDRLEKLMDLRDRWEQNETRKAFVAAMSAFKAHAITVIKDKDNAQYGSKYVSLGNLVTTVTPFLSEHELSVRWDIDQSNGIKVTCIITHAAGHYESVSMICPPDKSGAKNPIQEIKSAITYAKACTFESICGLASTDANLDDDGNGTTEQWVEDYISAIEAADDAEECARIFREAYRKATDAKSQKAQRAFIQAKDARKRALTCK